MSRIPARIGAVLAALVVAVGAPSASAQPDAGDACRGKLRLQTVRFDTSSERIRVEDSVVLDEVARILRACPEIDVRIEGHTDARGTDALNLDLSQRRAAAVRRYLVASGIEARRLTAVGRGRSQPLQRGEGEQVHRINRRVTLDFVERSP